MTIFRLLAAVALFFPFAEAQAAAYSMPTRSCTPAEVEGIKTLALQGNPEFQMALGGIYQYGMGVPSNYQEAVKWYRMAAEQGCALAQVKLGEAYFAGEGTEQSNSAGLVWYTMAAEQGLEVAQIMLGLLYYDDDSGVKKDIKKAFMWLSKGLAQDTSGLNQSLVTTAQGRLGACYLVSASGNRNEREAIKWLMLAAEKGDTFAQLNLGICYYGGVGVEKNTGIAIQWLGKAEAQGVDFASYLIKKVRAAESGNKDAQRFFKVFLASLTDSEAERLSKAIMEAESQGKPMQELQREVAQWERNKATTKPRKKRKKKDSSSAEETSGSSTLVISVLAALGIGAFAGFAFQRRKKGRNIKQFCLDSQQF